MELLSVQRGVFSKGSINQQDQFILKKVMKINGNKIGNI
jgi:hypothetical protein